MNLPRGFLSWLAGAALAVLGIGAVASWRNWTIRPDDLLRQGQAALLTADWETVQRLADRLEAAGHPDHGHLLRGLGYLRRARNNPTILDRAILEYNQIRHDRPDVLTEASLDYGLGFYSLGKPVQAERFLRYVVQQRPDDVEAHQGLAAIYYDLGAMEQALHHAQRWAELAPEDGRPHRFLGVMHASLASDEDAVRYYREALRRQLKPPVLRDTTLELAELLVKRTAFAEALSLLDNLEAEPGETLSTTAELRAECLYHLGRRSESLAVLNQTAASRLPSPRALRVQAQIQAEEGAFNEAASLLEKALAGDPHDTSCRYQLALVYDRLQRPAEAAEQRRLLELSQKLFQQLHELTQEAAAKPRDAGVRQRLAEVCRQLNKPALADMWQRAAAALAPE